MISRDLSESRCSVEREVRAEEGWTEEGHALRARGVCLKDGTVIAFLILLTGLLLMMSDIFEEFDDFWSLTLNTLMFDFSARLQ